MPCRCMPRWRNVNVPLRAAGSLRSLCCEHPDPILRTSNTADAQLLLDKRLGERLHNPERRMQAVATYESIT